MEFTLAGIAAIFLLISTVELAVGMWNYFTLARAVNAGARLASIRGSGCSSGGNSCSITVGTIATAVSKAAIGLPAANFNVTLTTNSGANTTCNPLSTCLSNATVWPPSTDNLAGDKVTVTATYNFATSLYMFWPGKSPTHTATVTFPASSTQLILF
jgi:hypothetical protein